MLFPSTSLRLFERQFNPERGTLLHIARKLLGKSENSSLNRPVEEAKLLKAFKAALNISAYDKPRYSWHSLVGASHPNELGWMVASSSRPLDCLIDECL